MLSTTTAFQLPLPRLSPLPNSLPPSNASEKVSNGHGFAKVDDEVPPGRARPRSNPKSSSRPVPYSNQVPDSGLSLSLIRLTPIQRFKLLTAPVPIDLKIGCPPEADLTLKKVGPSTVPTKESLFAGQTVPRGSPGWGVPRARDFMIVCFRPRWGCVGRVLVAVSAGVENALTTVHLEHLEHYAYGPITIIACRSDKFGVNWLVKLGYFEQLR